MVSKVPDTFRIQSSFLTVEVPPCCLPPFLMTEKDRKITAVSPAKSSPELRRAINGGKGQEVGVTHEPGENR